MEFNYVNFQPSDLDRMNTERDPEIYGSIFVKNGRNYYIADVEWETIFAYGRRGISINVYESNDIMQHILYIEEIKSIITATNYQRFKKRVENEIGKLLNYGRNKMKVKCLNCGHEFETTEIEEDNLGQYCICEECGASFDVDVDEIVEGK